MYNKLSYILFQHSMEKEWMDCFPTTRIEISHVSCVQRHRHFHTTISKKCTHNYWLLSYKRGIIGTRKFTIHPRNWNKQVKWPFPPVPSIQGHQNGGEIPHFLRNSLFKKFVKFVKFLNIVLCKKMSTKAILYVCSPLPTTFEIVLTTLV